MAVPGSSPVFLTFGRDITSPLLNGGTTVTRGTATVVLASEVAPIIADVEATTGLNFNPVGLGPLTQSATSTDYQVLTLDDTGAAVSATGEIPTPVYS